MATLKQQLLATQEKVIEANAEIASLRDAKRQAEYRAAAAEEAAKKEVRETRAMFDDLKLRLATAEMENQRMRGYIARVQEDDVVREELVMVGEPDGEQQMVPKRKPTEFLTPNNYTQMERSDEYGLTYEERQRRQRNAKHWITY